MARLGSQHTRVKQLLRNRNRFHVRLGSMASFTVLAIVGLIAAGNPAALAFLPSTSPSISTSSTPRTLSESWHTKDHAGISTKICSWRKVPCNVVGTTTMATAYWRSFNIGFVTRSRGRQALGIKMAVSSEEHHSVAIGGGNEQAAGSQGYGMPMEASIELVRLELAEVPVGKKYTKKLFDPFGI